MKYYRLLVLYKVKSTLAPQTLSQLVEVSWINAWLSFLMAWNHKIIRCWPHACAHAVTDTPQGMIYRSIFSDFELEFSFWRTFLLHNWFKLFWILLSVQVASSYWRNKKLNIIWKPKNKIIFNDPFNMHNLNIDMLFHISVALPSNA